MVFLKALSEIFCGAIFGLGLAVSGMTDQTKVIGFLDVLGQWQPDLLFVIGSAVLITTVGFYLVLKRSTPLFSMNFHLPTKDTIDKKLILGAIIFGIGWGLYGYCPGPAISALAYGNSEPLLFIGAMILGMATNHFFIRKVIH